MDHLINKYLNTDLTKEELERLELWLQSDTKNRIEFENIVAHLKHSDTEVELAKRRIYDQVVSKNNKFDNGRLSTQQKLRYILKVAAVFIMALTTMFLIFKYDSQMDTPSNLAASQHINHIEKEAAFGQQLSFVLPDGTTVKLNAGSKLIYPKIFSSPTREVRLTGEAFFDVKRDETKPFVIAAKGVNVRVLGTSFNVRSYEDEENTSVGVRTGIVKVSSLDGKQEILLHENDLANYSDKTNLVSKNSIRESSLVFGWIERELVLKDHTIDQILKELTRWYDVEFSIVGGDLDNQRKFTTRYKNPSLKSVMESLSYAYEFKYEINEKAITIIKN